jgi:hypothetical protein
MGRSDGVGWVLWAGTVGGQFGPHSKGIFPALYYYGLLHAFENGYRTADYCGSRPQLTDGILQLKRRWGARIADGWTRDSLFFLPTNLEAGSLAFLAGNPFVARVGRNLVGKVFLAHAPAELQDVARAEQLYLSRGLSAVRLYSLQPPAAEVQQATAAVPGVELVDLSREREPVNAYCRD